MPQPAPVSALGDDSQPASPPKALPDMKRLATGAVLACLPLVAALLVLGHPHIALGAAAGTGVCIALYAFLRRFVAGVMGVLAPGAAGQVADPGVGAAKTLFLVGSIGKFIVIGIVLFVLISVLKANIFGFVAGFVVSQVAVTIIAVKHLATLSES
ncbi:MAG: ATP synthase subunit I [Capsulimonadaceae bacterium]|nr:ATP synthase subunit I [Capsulimonadaceae bacterium]